jgi:hypothetical protein
MVARMVEADPDAGAPAAEALEGASLTRHRPWPARRGPGQAVKDEWLRREELRGGGVPDIRP